MKMSVEWCQDAGRGTVYASSAAVSETNKTCFKWYFVWNKPSVAREFWVHYFQNPISFVEPIKNYNIPLANMTMGAETPESLTLLHIC